MGESRTINLIELLTEPGKKGRVVVFEDDCFRRESIRLKLDSVIDAHIIVDSLSEFSVKCGHVSLHFSKAGSVEFVFENAQIAAHSQGHLITDGKKEWLFWIPKEPASRFYDDKGRIEKEQESAFQVTPEPGGFRLGVTVKDKSRVEFSVVLFLQNTESFIREIINLNSTELRKVTRGLWFCYQGPGDVWDYFINGSFYSTRHRYRQRVWESQNIAAALYYHLDYLYNQTAKEIYRRLVDFIAYSVMLSLPEDGRWRHGINADIMETHTVHQAAGIHLFLSYYERTGREFFLEKAKGALDYLISIADNLSETEIWFLHDSLELNLTDARWYYDPFMSQVFGKSLSNTLCLNSHILTLTVLYRLSQYDSSGRYKLYFEKGLKPLQKVLQARPAEVLYKVVYGINDILTRNVLRSKNRWLQKIQNFYNQTLKNHILPHMKQTFPRLVMPNGFIERDLTHSTLSEFYHFLNIEVILALYNQVGQDWLLPIIEKNIKYSIDSGFYLYLTERDPRAMAFLNALLLYSGTVDDQYVHLLPGFIARYRDLYAAIPANMLSYPLVADAAGPWRVDNENVLIFAPADGKIISAIIINTGEKDEKVRIKSDFKNKLEDFEVIDSADQKFPWRREFLVPRGSYLKIARKHEQNQCNA
ncbi:D-glucuronyl C5-epimerase family protein [Planctomycetota bacterium]